MATESPKWLGIHPISSKDHEQLLELQAAMNEFGHKMPRHEAEQKAHDEYVTDQLRESAAHHLGCLHTAHAGGDLETAKKHGAMYVLACKKLGHDAVGTVPPEIAAKLKTRKPTTRFKAHAADAFLLEPKEEATEDVKKSELKYRTRADGGKFGYQGRHDRECKCGKKFGDHTVAHPHTTRNCDGFKPKK
jgi:hypothetical protein